MNQAMIEGMRHLCTQAKVITPNLTEAAFLLGENSVKGISAEQTLAWCKALSQFGPEHVIITSAPGNNPQDIVTIAYNRTDNRYWEVVCDHIPASYPGTGDAFASVITGCPVKRRQSSRSRRPCRSFYQHGYQSHIRLHA